MNTFKYIVRGIMVSTLFIIPFFVDSHSVSAHSNMCPKGQYLDQNDECVAYPKCEPGYTNDPNTGECTVPYDNCPYGDNFNPGGGCSQVTSSNPSNYAPAPYYNTPVQSYTITPTGVKKINTGTQNGTGNQNTNYSGVQNTNAGPGTVSGTQGSGAPATAQQTFAIKNPLNVNSVGGLISKFVEIFSYIAILLAVLAIVWVGFQFILAQGKPDRMNELKTWLLWIVVGIAVVIGARLMVDIVINTLGATGVVDQGVIQSVRSANSGN
ncbi:MAG: TrbC/VirB2 family protein [Candidatus Taylorbacteria bacterium]